MHQWNLIFCFVCVITQCIVCEAEELDGIEEGKYFEGDIILTPEQIDALEEQRSKRNSFASIKSNHWKTRGKADIIKYYIDKDDFGNYYHAQETITRAIGEYHKHTCIRFEEVNSLPSPPYIHFVKEEGCFSSVGRLSWGNRISLGYGCWNIGTTMHEIAHALGFFHEQSRPDRDNYVDIIWSNIKPSEKHNFEKYTTRTIDSLDTEYDYESIMHYRNNAFAINRRSYTIRTIDPSKRREIGQREGFSKIDKIQMNRLYCGTSGTDGYTRPTPLTKAPTTEMGCIDVYPKNCKEMWFDECDRWYVQKNCKKTCNLCVNGVKTEPLQTTTTKQPTQEPTKALTTSASNCQDGHRSCSSWVEYCSSNTYVKTNCLKTCGKC